MNGASDAEVKDAIAMAALTRHWSTVLNGLQIDEKKFKSEADRILMHASHPMAKADKKKH